ncbi:alpha-N-acetylgalactosaminidase-like isoform X2 [Patiria miniata]|uniref:Alpha-galactosidase n=1 Tax=Patiria miniata TaxID=46514 RepID=A0A913ZWQ5_PATMI|nr:alpha-N-acetylgalactosaminidase-like isoform X2 [Patiria miniata]
MVVFRMSLKLALALFLLGAFYPILEALDNGLARTPPMGWLTWERFRCDTNCKKNPKNCISENLMMEMADRMAEDGYKDAGYEYVNLDDCWSAKERDAQERLQGDPERFPSGMKALGNYIHSRGLKFGIYADYGTKTCSGFPGSWGHFELDAQTFADWGVDMMKLDSCSSNVTTYSKGYPEMAHALNATGRPILFNCKWPFVLPHYGMKINYTLIAEYCNTWRNFWDIREKWSLVLMIVDYYALNQDVLIPASGPGHFNDPDMLVVGDNGLTVDQAQAHFAMWSILAAPLLMANDLRNISIPRRNILLNKEVIAVNQDPLGIMGRLVLQFSDRVNLWVKQLSKPQEWAVVFLNRYPSPQTVSLSLQQLGLKSLSGYNLRDIITHSDIGYRDSSKKYKYTIPATGALMMRIHP